MTDLMDRVFHTPAGDFTVADLQERIEVIEPGIIAFREIPGGSADAFAVSMQLIKERGEAFGDYALVLDIGEATRPGPRLIELVLKSAREVGIHWAVVQAKSALMRSVSEFVMRRLKNMPVTMHATKQDAVERAREALRERAAPVPSRPGR